MDESRTRLCAVMGVDSDEIHFGPSTSQNTYVLAQAVRMGMPKGEIVVTDQDHEANSGAWRRLDAEGFTIREWKIDPETGSLDPADLDALLSDQTRVVCFPMRRTSLPRSIQWPKFVSRSKRRGRYL